MLRKKIAQEGGHEYVSTHQRLPKAHFSVAGKSFKPGQTRNQTLFNRVLLLWACG